MYCIYTYTYTYIHIHIYKLITIIVNVILFVDDSPTSAQGQGLEKLIWLLQNSYKMLVLAGIYAAMNILSFVAFTGIHVFMRTLTTVQSSYITSACMYTCNPGIGAGEFTVCAQLKVLTTAGFSVLVLGTSVGCMDIRKY